MFAVEFVAGSAADSRSLQADAFDFLGDSAKLRDQLDGHQQDAGLARMACPLEGDDLGCIRDVGAWDGGNAAAIRQHSVWINHRLHLNSGIEAYEWR